MRRIDIGNESSHGRAVAEAPSPDRPCAEGQAPDRAYAGPPLLLTARQAAALCGVSAATWWRWDNAGRCPAPVRIGATVRWRAAELAEWTRAGCPGRVTWQAMTAQRSGRGA